MGLNSQLDKDGEVKKTKNDSQYAGDKAAGHGGDNGTGSGDSAKMQEKKPGKMFAGE
jgi:hypothetical protein